MASQAVPPKPITAVWRPDLTRLPSLHFGRRLFRRLAHYVARALLYLLTHTSLSGLENLPRGSPALLAVNHLGDADALLLLAAFPSGPEVLAKIELLDFPVLGWLLDWYGAIWLHRGRPDRRALRAAQQAFAEGRQVIVAPEGRYSLANGLEAGGNGAAYLARKSRVPVIPVALTGTQNSNVYGELRRLHRPTLSLKVGHPLALADGQTTAAVLDADTRRIMRALAALLPPEYRGVYG